MPWVLQFILAMAIIVLSSDHANAAGAGMCEAFSKTIEEQAKQNVANRCGFSSAQNYNNPIEQKRWCRESKEEVVSNESQRRNVAATRCAACRKYSDEANAVAHDNALFHCGYSGGRWGPGEGHFQWCMTVENCGETLLEEIAGSNICDPFINGIKTSIIDPEAAARRAEINQCKAEFTESQISKCRQYADAALKQASFNAANKLCQNPGGRHTRWSTDWDDHFAFCTWGWKHDMGGRNIVDLMDEEDKIRKDDLNKCTLAIKWHPKPVKALGKKKLGQGLAAPSRNQNGTPGQGNASPAMDMLSGGGISTTNEGASNKTNPALRQRLNNPSNPAGGGFNTDKGGPPGTGDASKVMNLGAPIGAGASPPIGKIVPSR